MIIVIIVTATTEMYYNTFQYVIHNLKTNVSIFTIRIIIELLSIYSK